MPWPERWGWGRSWGFSQSRRGAALYSVHSEEPWNVLEMGMTEELVLVAVWKMYWRGWKEKSGDHLGVSCSHPSKRRWQRQRCAGGLRSGRQACMLGWGKVGCSACSLPSRLRARWTLVRLLKLRSLDKEWHSGFEDAIKSPILNIHLDSSKWMYHIASWTYVSNIHFCCCLVTELCLTLLWPHRL